jgi:phage shock protein PspC (stress-responsive transcriptional regulator)
MKKVISINIAGVSFFIDEDAYVKLNVYLEKLNKRFGENDEGQEIIADVETRFSELFAERINPKTGVITIEMVEEVIQIMGRPEDFSDTEDDNSTETGLDNEVYTSKRRRLYRDTESRIIGGVCAGIAAYFNIDPVFVRIIFVILPFISLGIIIPIYIILWIVVPAAVTTTQKMEMKGENITVSNIEKNIREEYDDVRKRFANFRKTNKTYRKSEDYVKRNRRIVIIAAIIILSIIFGNLSEQVNFWHLFPFPLFTFLFTISIILLTLGLIFPSSLKGFLLTILILAIVSFFITIALAFGNNLFHLYWHW